MPANHVQSMPQGGRNGRSSSPPPWIAGRQWAQFGLRQPGWLILPLRGFLAVTFVYAGLQKLANPAYLNPNNPASVVGQMQTLRHSSPIGPLLGLSMHAPTLVGLLIAFGELAVGVGALVGLFTRLAALGGMVLSLTFLLTVSWSTTPYYFGSDIAFFFAWSAVAALGAGGVLSLDGWLHSRAALLGGLGAAPVAFTVDAQRLRTICPEASNCGLDPSSGCRRRGRCPILGTESRSRIDAEPDLKRRQLLLGARAAVIVSVGALAAGGATAWIGRLAGGTSRRHRAASDSLRPPTTKPSVAPTASPQRTHAKRPAPGVAIGSASSLPVGQAARFTDPGSGGPAWLVQPAAGHFVAFSATCTHAGCPVNFEAANLEFVCPCHGGAYDAQTGRVVSGPPPSPLPSIPVHVINGKIRVD